MKTPKHQPPDKSDDKATVRKPRPLKPASWLDEVKPDDDVMAVFYGRSPAPPNPVVPDTRPEPPATRPPLESVPAPLGPGKVGSLETPPNPVREPVQVAPPDTNDDGIVAARPPAITQTPPPALAEQRWPASREADFRSPGLTRESDISRGRPDTGVRETGLPTFELPSYSLPDSQIPVSRSADFRETAQQSPAAGEAHWPSRRYKIRVQTRIPQSLNEELTAYCDRRGVTRDSAIDRAIRMLLADDSDTRETISRETGLPAIGLPASREAKRPAHDHDEDHDSKIIMIFERETGRKFRADERHLLPEFRETDPTIVQDAIRYAVKYSREPVGSFAYCAKVIRQRTTRRPSGEAPRPDDERSEPSETNGFASSAIPSAPDEDRRRFEIRAAAARLREARRDDPTYTRDRLVEDVRAGFLIQGRDLGIDQIEDALRGLAL